MADLKPDVDTTPHVIHEDDPLDQAKNFPDESRWRITATRNDEPVVDRDNPPCRVIWETHYLGDDGTWHAGTPPWGTWLRLLPKVHQAGLVVGRRGGIDETKAKAARRGQPVAERLRVLVCVMVEDGLADRDEIANVAREAADLLCPGEPKDEQLATEPPRVAAEGRAERMRKRLAGDLRLAADTAGPGDGSAELIGDGTAALMRDAAQMLDPAPMPKLVLRNDSGKSDPVATGPPPQSGTVQAAQPDSDRQDVTIKAPCQKITVHGESGK